MKTFRFFKMTVATLMIAAVAISFTRCADGDSYSGSSASLMGETWCFNAAGTSTRISVNNPYASFTYFAQNQWKDVADAGLVKVGDHFLRNILWQSGNSYTCSCLMYHYGDGGFTIDLVATVDAKYLAPHPYFGEEIPEGITVSDPEFKCTIIREFVGYKADVRTVYFNNDIRSSEKHWSNMAFYLYADRDVTATGSGLIESQIQTYNMSLKKGWNIVYLTCDVDEATKNFTFMYMTGSEPEGLRWIYGFY